MVFYRVSTCGLVSRQRPPDAARLTGSGVRGFTLVELLVVIAIISILAGMMLRPAPTYPSRSRAPSSRASKVSACGHRSSEEPVVVLSSPTGLQGDQVNG